MSRCGYDDLDPLDLGRWRAQVKSAIRGKRGQAFLREMAEALDAMPVKELIAGELVTDSGDVCAIGAVCVRRGLDVRGLDITDPENVGNAVGIARQLAAEIEYINDECGMMDIVDETPSARWKRVRRWVADKITKHGG